MPLKVDLNELLTHPGEHIALEVNEVPSPDLDFRCDGRLVGTLHFSSTTNLLVVRGSLAAAVITECPRCLTEVRTAIMVEVDEEFTVEHGLVTGLADDEGGMEDPAIKALCDGVTLNVTELMRQSMVLALPAEPVCRDDCRGLCQQCGANLNDGDCGCAPIVDSPFEVLARLAAGEPETTSGPD